VVVLVVFDWVSFAKGFTPSCFFELAPPTSGADDGSRRRHLATLPAGNNSNKLIEGIFRRLFTPLKAAKRGLFPPSLN
jgi:hypothetical protein